MRLNLKNITATHIISSVPFSETNKRRLQQLWELYFDHPPITFHTSTPDTFHDALVISCFTPMHITLSNCRYIHIDCSKPKIKPDIFLHCENTCTTAALSLLHNWVIPSPHPDTITTKQPILITLTPEKWKSSPSLTTNNFPSLLELHLLIQYSHCLIDLSQTSKPKKVLWKCISVFLNHLPITTTCYCCYSEYDIQFTRSLLTTSS